MKLAVILLGAISGGTVPLEQFPTVLGFAVKGGLPPWAAQLNTTQTSLGSNLLNGPSIPTDGFSTVVSTVATLSFGLCEVDKTVSLIGDRLTPGALGAPFTKKTA